MRVVGFGEDGVDWMPREWNVAVWGGCLMVDWRIGLRFVDCLDAQLMVVVLECLGLGGRGDAVSGFVAVGSFKGSC